MKKTRGSMMLNNDQGSSAFWFFIGLIIIFASIPLDLGKVRTPGTGFMPFLTGIAICSFSVIGFFHATVGNGKGKKWKNFLKGVRWEKPLLAMASLVVYAFLLEKLGFLLDTILLIAFLLKAIEPQKWLIIILGALFTSAAMYIIFQVWLQVQLPAGILKF
jgi:putative tricarboxylic transport membrane protein